MNLKLGARPAQISLLAATVGVSISTAIGNSAGVYFASVAAAGFFAVISLVRTSSILSPPTLLAFFVTFWLLGATFTREAMGLVSISMGDTNDIAKIIAILVILLVTISSSRMPTLAFRHSFSIIALTHVAILIFGLLTGDVTIRALSDPGDFVRFEGAGFATASWAEVALGTIMAAVLSRNRAVFVMGFIVGLYAILAADMRTTLVGSTVVVAILLIGAVEKIQSAKKRLFLWAGGSALAIISVVLIHEYIFDAVSNLLLLNDPYRGVQSGFSNRFENLEAGWESFLDAIFLGAGFGNPIVNYTHNGYILTIAQMGAPVGLLLFFLFFKSVFKAARRHDFLLLSVILGLSAFYLGQPRNINFQLCPLVGIIAVGRSLLWSDAEGGDSSRVSSAWRARHPA